MNVETGLNGKGKSHVNGLAHSTAAVPKPKRRGRATPPAPKPEQSDTARIERINCELDALRSRWIPQIERYRDELGNGVVELEQARVVARMHRRDSHYGYPEQIQQINDETINQIINGPCNAADGLAHATEALCEVLRETDQELRELVEHSTFAFFDGLAAMLRRLNLIECFAGGYHDAVTMPAEDVMELLAEVSICLALFRALRVAE